MWQGWVIGIIGLWLIINGIAKIWMSPIHFIIAGVIIGVFGFWSVFKKK